MKVENFVKFYKEYEISYGVDVAKDNINDIMCIICICLLQCMAVSKTMSNQDSQNLVRKEAELWM